MNLALSCGDRSENRTSGELVGGSDDDVADDDDVMPEQKKTIH